MPIPFLTVTLLLREIEVTDVERLLRVLHNMGGTFQVVEYPPPSTATPPPPDISDPDPLPPNLPWWASLTVTTPRTKIYADVPGAQVYFSSDPAHEPSFEMKEIAAGKPRTVLLGASVEVWRAPLPLSGWICVANLPGKALWVRGEEMRAIP